MTPAQQLAIDELRNAGYAVAIFTPEELSGVRADRVEDAMVYAGGNNIDILKGEEEI